MLIFRSNRVMSLVVSPSHSSSILTSFNAFSNSFCSTTDKLSIGAGFSAFILFLSKLPFTYLWLQEGDLNPRFPVKETGDFTPCLSCVVRNPCLYTSYNTILHQLQHPIIRKNVSIIPFIEIIKDTLVC